MRLGAPHAFKCCRLRDECKSPLFLRRGYMVRVKFIQRDGEHRIVETYAGLSLMEAAAAAGVEGIDAICGGSCICGTCHVYVEAPKLSLVGPPSEDENAVLEETGVQQSNSRLSCQVRLSEVFEGMTFVVAPPRHD